MDNVTNDVFCGNGGNGGCSGGLSRSILDFTTSDKIHCNIDENVTTFGPSMIASAGKEGHPGSGKGGNDFNTTGGKGGVGGRGGYILGGECSHNKRNSCTNGQRGENNGSLGGIRHPSLDGVNISYCGGPGGGGACYTLPSNIKYDDPLYTTYIKRDLSMYKGGYGACTDNGYWWSGETKGDPYPLFDSEHPIWYGGGNGGSGGGRQGNCFDGRPTNVFHPGVIGSAGSPGGILIEKAVY